MTLCSQRKHTINKSIPFGFTSQNNMVGRAINSITYSAFGSKFCRSGM